MYTYIFLSTENIHETYVWRNGESVITYQNAIKIILNTVINKCAAHPVAVHLCSQLTVDR